MHFPSAPGRVALPLFQEPAHFPASVSLFRSQSTAYSLDLLHSVFRYRVQFRRSRYLAGDKRNLNKANQYSNPPPSRLSPPANLPFLLSFLIYFPPPILRDAFHVGLYRRSHLFPEIPLSNDLLFFLFLSFSPLPPFLGSNDWSVSPVNQHFGRTRIYLEDVFVYFDIVIIDNTNVDNTNRVKGIIYGMSNSINDICIMILYHFECL